MLVDILHMMRRYTRVLLLICIASFFLFILLSLVQLSGYDGGDYDDDGDEKQFYGIHRLVNHMQILC